MKIVLTGSLGHISKPLAQQLISKGHNVTLISSSSQRQEEITALGATPAIGSVTDAGFLTRTFKGADAVYTMVPPPSNYSDPAFDAMAYSKNVRNAYFEALATTGVKHVVNLSSWGAHRDSGTGGIVTTYYMEQLLNTLPNDVAITHVRPTSFYYNMFSFIPRIKQTGQIALNYGGEDRISLVAPEDIAEAVAEVLENIAEGRNVRYVASDEQNCNEIARVLGKAIGMPDLQWIRISDEQAKNNLEAAGLRPAMAAGIAEIQGAIHKGLLAEHYILHKPAKMGKIKIADFAKVFAAKFHANNYI